MAQSREHKQNLAILKWQAGALRAAERQEWHEAAAKMEHATRIQPHNAEWWIQTARFQRLAGDLDGAQSTLQRGVAANRENTNIETSILLRLALSELLFEAQNWAECIATCREVLAIRPTQHFALEMLSTSLLHSDQIAAATEILQRLLQVSPRDPLHRMRYATLLQVQGQAGEAMQEWERIVALYPESPFADEADEAIELLDKAQIQNVLLRAAEQSTFGWQLQRDFDAALNEHEIYLSEAGRETLRQIVWDGRPDETAPPTAPRIH